MLTAMVLTEFQQTGIRRINIAIRLEGMNQIASVDTGCTTSTIAISVKEQIDPYGVLPYRPASDRLAISVSKEMLPILGELDVVITMGAAEMLHTVCVIQNSQSSCVLGIDFLRRLQIVDVDLSCQNFIYTKKLITNQQPFQWPGVITVMAINC